MAIGVAQKVPRKRRARSEKNEDRSTTVEIELGGRTIEAPEQTVTSGAGSVSRFFGRLMG
jgi:hypothetical protein